MLPFRSFSLKIWMMQDTAEDKKKEVERQFIALVKAATDNIKHTLSIGVWMANVVGLRGMSEEMDVTGLHGDWKMRAKFMKSWGRFGELVGVVCPEM